jgi:hypothetical protein
MDRQEGQVLDVSPAAPGQARGVSATPRAQSGAGSDLTYSDGIAAARTMLALEANAVALQRRLPSG